MGANNFILLPLIQPGTATGPQASVDLYSIVPPSGLNKGFTVLCSGRFSGTIAIEGSLDGIGFNPMGEDEQGRSVGSFGVGALSVGSGVEFSPLVVNETVRYIRARLAPGCNVLETVTISIGGSANCGCEEGVDELSSESSLLVVSPDPGVGRVTFEQVIAADWPVGRLRIYAVDPVNGDDEAVGYADLDGSSTSDYAEACQAAGLVARKTFSGLAAIFPRYGFGRLVEIVLCNAGENTAHHYTGGLDVFLEGSTGWAAGCPFVRTTGTNPSAGAVAFDGSIEDFNYQGAITIPGLNVAGYNPTGSATTISLPCLQVGGAAPSLPAEPAAPLGWRIRFDDNTFTAALRNVCRQICQVSSGTTVTPNLALPATPVTQDVFYLEQCGVTCDATILSLIGTGPSPAFYGAQLSGIRIAGNLQFSDFRGRVAFLGCATSNATGYIDLTTSSSLDHPILGIRTIGGGLRYTTGSASFQHTTGGFLTFANLVTPTWLTVDGVRQINWGVGCYCLTELSILNHLSNPGDTFPHIGITATLGRPRIAGGDLNLLGGSCLQIGGCVIEGSGDTAAIRTRTANSVICFDKAVCSGSVGNNNYGLDLADCRNATIIILTVPTVTGALGDIRLLGGHVITWAQAAATGVVDEAGNRILGLNGSPPLTISKFSGCLNGDAGAVFSYMYDAGPVTTANRTTPAGYPTSLRIATRLRAKSISNTSANPVTVALYKNGVATLMKCTFSAGQTGKLVDSSHPVLFLDGDEFDVRIDDASADPGSLVLMSASLEWAS